MAAGCVPVGFTGFGGWEYMRQAADDISASAADAAFLRLQRPPRPDFSLAGSPLPDPPADAVPAGGNGWYYSDGDILGAGLSLARAVQLARAGGPVWEGVRENSLATARLYTEEARGQRLRNLWPLLTA